MKKPILLFFLLIFFALPLTLPAKVWAVKYTITAPSGTLNRGDNVQFTVSIDTQGEAVVTGQTEVSYKTQYLQYVSTAVGSFFTTATGTDTGSTIKLNGSVTSAKTGSGTFAIITFKLIASAPGETELCTIVSPTPTPGGATSTPTPTGIQPTSTPGPTITSGPTSTPGPTVSQLPRSGSTEITLLLSAIGVSASTIGLLLKKIGS